MVDFNFNINTAFYGVVRDDKIYNQNGQLVGYTVEQYNKALETAKGFENILYEKGILTKPKTPEEINQEMQEAMNKMSLSIQALTKKIEILEKVNDKQGKDSESGK